MDTKLCSDCNKNKPVSEFYFHKHRGVYYKRCKVCHKALKDKYKGSEPAIPTHEAIIVERLKSLGFPAMNGSHTTLYPHVDILVWGYIRVEAKALIPYVNKSGYYASNTVNQVRRGWLADVICILYEDGLYLFKPDFPAFYINGRLRSKILYNPLSQRTHLTDNRKLTNEDMTKAKDRYSLLMPELPVVLK